MTDETRETVTALHEVMLAIRVLRAKLDHPAMLPAPYVHGALDLYVEAVSRHYVDEDGKMLLSTRGTRDTVTAACDHCGTELHWTLAQLKYHLERLDRGEHAACACDDDCAYKVRQWDRANLAFLMGVLSIMTHSLSSIVPGLERGYRARALVRRIQARLRCRGICDGPTNILRWLRGAGYAPDAIRAIVASDGRYVGYLETQGDLK